MSAAPHIVRALDPHAPEVGDVATSTIFTERDFRYGRIRYLTTDFGVGKMLTMYGEYSEGEVAVFRRLLRLGDCVVSAGGNIGVHLVPLSQIVGAQGRVITFEPQEFVREKLLQPNLAMNGCGNVEVRIEALGEAAGIASLPAIDYTIPNNFGGMEIRDEGPCPVPVIALDSLGLGRLDMLMLDVEGYELAALAGARQTIMRHRPFLYVEIDREDARESVLHFMKDELKYELLYHTPTCYNPDNFDANPENPFGNMCSVMCLGVPL